LQPSLSTYLDFVRYLAALLVFVGHAAGRQWTGGLFWQIGGYGQTAVMIFFVLSGFVIAHVVASREQEVADFAATRLARLWSVVLPALALTFAIDYVGIRVAPDLYVGKPWYHGDDPWLRYSASALFVHDFWGLGLVPGVNGPFWSISYEFAYYVIFAAAALVRSRALGVMLAVTGALLSGPTIVALFPIWLMGVLAYKVVKRPPPGPVTGWLLFGGSLAVLAASPWLRDRLHPYSVSFVHRDVILGDYIDGAATFVNIVAFTAVAPAFEGLLQRWRAPIVYLASTSFALYLFHRPLLQLFTYIGPENAEGLARRVFVFIGIPLVVVLLTPPTERFKRALRVWLLSLLRWHGALVRSASRSSSTEMADAPSHPNACGMQRTAVPRVSVIVPAHNAAAHVRTAVGSVLAQTWQDLELLVVDDGSTDGTHKLLAGYGARLRVLRQANAGPAAARNHGLREARGEYVAFLDADDFWETEKLAAQVALLDANADVGFCSTATRVVDGAGNVVALWPCLPPDIPLPDALFMNGAAISGSTSGVMARRALLQQVGGFDAALRGFEDPDLWTRLAACARYACIPQALTVVVRTPGSVSSHLPRMRAATLASFRKNRGLLPPPRRGTYWRTACAGALTDYAKTAWRAGDRRHALLWTLEALIRAPLGRGRLALALLLAMLRGQAF
jgi:peptidoglycan/LPS O-acetylase OafA/YrhL